MVKAFVVLLSAHLLADYLLQSDWMAKNKGRAGGLLSHSLVHVFTSLAFMWSLAQWPVCAAIGVIHTGLDYTKNKVGPAWGPFVIDQILHTTSIALAVYVFGKMGHFDNFAIDPYLFYAQLFAGGAAAVVWGVYYFLFKFAPGEKLSPSAYLHEKVLRGIIFGSVALSFADGLFLAASALAVAAHVVFSARNKTPLRGAVSIGVAVATGLLAVYTLKTV